MRIAYRFVFAGVAEDDRSDNEEVELAEEAAQAELERELEIKDRLRVEQGKPALMLNGDPLSPVSPMPNGHASGSWHDDKADGVTKRKVEVGR